ncbi:MAG: PEP-CTERM sorting domain-containing protein [Burkholderiales bacterium]|nr:PEP-CTERM sorting domain-containing protein [Burkholderiales bacterium]
MDRTRIVKSLFGLCLALGFVGANAAIVSYQAGDPGTSLGSATPNSDAAAASFDAAAGALGSINLINFESAPLGTFSSLLIAPGVTASGLGYTGAATHSIRAGDRCGSVCGFNTTSAGRLYLDVDANFITLSFATPISAFGVYITGLQLEGETVNFNDGTSQTLTLTNFGSGAQFFGFTDAGNLISSIVIDTRNPSNTLGDFIGLDDIRYVTASTSSVPEPGTLALLGLGLAGFAASRRRRKP